MLIYLNNFGITMAALNINGFFPGEVLSSTTVAGCIDIFENVWPDPKDTILRVEKECSNPNSGAYWSRAETIGQGAFQDARTNNIMPVSHLAGITNNPLLQNVHNQFYTLLLASINPYSVKYGIEEPLYHEGYNLLKYSNNQEYKKHYDGGTKIARAISAVVYLNDDYEGGELEFPHFNVKIKPEAGMLILFPSNYAYAHVAHPVTSGTKYALVTWIRDQPF
jgi:predicted 2-oxoglutarate/Fe(II)-dependent dioxygenase YbiX